MVGVFAVDGALRRPPRVMALATVFANISRIGLPMAPASCAMCAAGVVACAAVLVAVGFG